MGMYDRGLLSRFKGILGAIAGMGMSFGGARDLYAVFGYSPTVTFYQNYAKYKRQDIAARIVETEPKATWSQLPMPGAKMPEGFAEQWDALVHQHNIAEVFKRLDVLCGLGKYAVLLVGFDDRRPLSSPLNTNRANKVTFLQPYAEVSATVKEYDQDPASPRFGKPKMYRIMPQKWRDLQSEGTLSTATWTSNEAFDVHYSRIIHVAENCLEDTIFGTPRLERVFNLLDDLLKVVGGSAETFWLTGNRGLHIDVDKDMTLLPEDAEDLAAEVDEYQNELRRAIRTKGVKVTSIGSDTPDPRGNFAVIMGLISGATGIPQRILLGTEAGQLASAQDRANLAVRISERRVLWAEPIVLNPFVHMMIEAGVLQVDHVEGEDGMYWEWPDAFIQNPLERAQTAAQTARSLANVSKALSDAVPVVTEEEGRRILGFSGPGPGRQAPSATVNDPTSDGVNGPQNTPPGQSGDNDSSTPAATGADE